MTAIEISSSTVSKEWYWVFTDHLGSITSLVRESDGQKFEMSFDAWGNRRDPATWVNYTTTLPDFIIDRGFTGHEHYDEFGLINMNGRVYDPVIARFLSPDNYVQAPELAQNYNGYVYCVNNPLKYTDPSGEFFVIDSWIIGLFSGGWKEANKRAGNDIKIWGGLFTSDPNKSFGGRFWETISRFTWQLPQTLGGFITSHSYNTFGLQGGVESVDYKYGATVLRTRNDGWGGVTQGSFIVGDNSIEADENNALFQHEYGHYIQSQSMGWAYYPRVGIPSIRSKGDHDFHAVEQDANRRAFLYFNKNIEGFQDDASLRDDNGWDFWSNPLNINGTNTRLQYVDYSDPNQVNSLDVLRIRAKWYDHASWLLLPVGGPVWVGLINSGIYNR